MGPEIGAGAAGLSAYTRRNGTAEDALKAAAMSEATGRGVAWASGKGQPGFMGTYSRQNPWQDLTGSTYFNPTTGTGGLDYMTLRPFNNQRMASTFDMGVDPFSQYGVQTPFGAGGVASRIGEMNTPALPSVPRYSWWDRIGKVGPALQGFAGLAGAVSDIYGTVVQKKLSEDNLSAWREAQKAENEWHLAQIENEKRKLEIEQKRYEQDYELGKRKLTFEEARTSPVTTEPFVMPNF
jgi:hypothetical protein